MRITFLGSGTSHGVPMIGCGCAVCRSDDPCNKRLRPSILVENEQRSIVVDTTPDFRQQALRQGLQRVDAVLITHTHADHIFGMDDLRRFNDLMGTPITVYGSEQSLADIRRIFQYVFVPTQHGGGKPRLILQVVPDRFELFGMEITAIPVLHGTLPVLGYRLDSIAYVTDVSYIPPESMALLRNLEVLILDTVRPKPHATHFGLAQALEVIEQLTPRRAFLTHLSHHYEHQATNERLPDGVRLAYDGLEIVTKATASSCV